MRQASSIAVVRRFVGHHRNLELLRFGMVGGATYLIFTGVAWFAETKVSAPHIIAVGTAYAAGLVFNFISHKLFTFRSTAPARTELVKYISVAVVSGVAITLCAIFVEPLWRYPIIYYDALLGVLLAVLSYAQMKLWIFKPS